MKRRRLLVLTAVALTVAVAVPSAALWHALNQRLARSRLIDQEHFSRIKEGMTKAEVEAILGGSPGDFRTTQVDYRHTCALPLDFKCEGGRWEWWTGDEGQIEILFDKRDTVAFGWVAKGAGPPSLAERVRDWLRRLWS